MIYFIFCYYYGNMVIYVFVLIDVLCDNGNSVYKERESIFKMDFGKSEYIVRK